MTTLAVIGSGPGAMYTIKYILKHPVLKVKRIDVLEKLRTPFGLVRFGVAPDHVEVKEVSKEFTQMINDHKDQIKLHTGSEVSGVMDFNALRRLYDAVVVATGAQSASRLPFPSLPRNTFSAQDFVLWYNGHPERQDLLLPEQARNVSIVGHGNVALDVARILSKSVQELDPLVQSGLLTRTAYDWLASRQSLSGPKSVSLLGRRGYMHAAFTNKEFRELTTMADATCKVNEEELDFTLSELKRKTLGDRAKSRGLSILQKCVESSRDDSKSNSIFLRFFAKPLRYAGDPVSALHIKNKFGAEEAIPVELGIESIGFKVVNDFGLPIDACTGGIANDGHGRVEGFRNVYAAGWAKRGPRGVIAANIPCCVETADAIVLDLLGKQ